MQSLLAKNKIGMQLGTHISNSEWALIPDSYSYNKRQPDCNDDIPFLKTSEEYKAMNAAEQMCWELIYSCYNTEPDETYFSLFYYDRKVDFELNMPGVELDLLFRSPDSYVGLSSILRFFAVLI